MNIVIDTNVLASAIFWKGTPAKILEQWHQGKFKFCVSPSILEEYYRVCHYLREKSSGTDPDFFLTLVAENSILVDDINFQHPICRDPDDDKFIACAISANAHYIVSGDKDLLDLKHYKSIAIVTPKAFLAII